MGALVTDIPDLKDVGAELLLDLEVVLLDDSGAEVGVFRDKGKTVAVDRLGNRQWQAFVEGGRGSSSRACSGAARLIDRTGRQSAHRGAWRTVAGAIGLDPISQSRKAVR